MTSRQREEIVNAARSYERIVAERRGYFVKSIRCAKEGCQAEAVAWRKQYWDSKSRAKAAEGLLAQHVYGEHDFIRVDGVIYMAYSTDTVLRIPIEDVPDLAAEMTFAAPEPRP